MRKGRLSHEEREYIANNAKIKTSLDIAKDLDRDVMAVSLYIKRLGLSPDKKASYEVQAEYNLKEKPQWKELRTQFTEKELELLLFHWKAVIGQFRKDVLPTEEMQILDMVKLEVLMNRALTEEHDTLKMIESYTKQILEEERKPPEDRNTAYIFELNRHIVSMRSAKQSLNANYKELQKAKNEMFKNLKATREQRIQKLEGNKTTLSGMISKLLGDPEFFEETGLYMERMKLAVESEKARLGDYHKYDDGMLDRPLLNSETVGEDD